MPFRSQAQMRAAFGGYLGDEMQAKARTWAHETPNLKALPRHVKPSATHLRRQALLSHMKGAHGRT